MKQLKQSLFASAIPFSAARRSFVKQPFAQYNEYRFERRNSSFRETSNIPYLGAPSPVYATARGAEHVLQQIELLDAFPSRARTGSRFDAGRRHTCSLDMDKLYAERESLRVSKLMRSGIHQDGCGSTAEFAASGQRVQPALGFSSSVKFVQTE